MTLQFEICRYCEREPHCIGACLNGEPTRFRFPKFPTISANDPNRAYYEDLAKQQGIAFGVDYANQIALWPTPPQKRHA